MNEGEDDVNDDLRDDDDIYYTLEVWGGDPPSPDFRKMRELMKMLTIRKFLVLIKMFLMIFKILILKVIRGS